MERDTKLRVAAGLFALGIVAGAASAQDKPAASQNAGFLPDYSKLAPAADNPKTRLWFDKSFDFKPYKQIMLDPVEVWVSPASEYKGASPDALKRMADNFSNSFRKALEPGYQVVKQPGPGVLRVRLAITGVNLVKPDMKPTDVLPVMFLIKAASGGMTSSLPAMSGEMQVLSPANEIVAAAVSTGTGDQKIPEKQEITWKELQAITDTWGKGLRRRLDEARGIAGKS